MSLVGVVLNVTKEHAAEAVRLIEFVCSEAGMDTPLIMASTVDDPGHVMTRRALDAGCDVVIAAGGDGTVRAVAAEIAGTDIALGVVPMGTGNLFARNIGLPHDDLLFCVQEAIHGQAHAVDTLQLQLKRADGSIDEELSMVIAGGGLDAEVMADTREALKARAGWLAYGESGLRHVAGRRKDVTVELDHGDRAEVRIRSVLLANCGTLQGGVRLVPTALFDDGQMDVVLLSPRNPWDWARIVAKTALRFGEDIPVMTVKQAAGCSLEMQEPMPFQIDGDAVGEVVGVKAEVVPSSLKVNGVARAVTDQTAG
ncbi:diacylglycerol/lipid kinase family protein [Nesterenkonia populi]